MWSHCSKQLIVFPLYFCGGIAQLALWFLAHPSLSLCIPAFLPCILLLCPCFSFKCLPNDHRTRARHKKKQSNKLLNQFPQLHYDPFFYVASSGSDVAQNASQSSDWLTDCVFQLPVLSLVGPGVRPACPGSMLAPYWLLLLKHISRSENFRDFM